MKPLPLVMPSNSTEVADLMETRHPHRMALLLSPSTRWSDPMGYPFAVDNGRFAVWKDGKVWDRGKFFDILDRAAVLQVPPRWVVVPDLVADALGTLREWDEWAPLLKEAYGWPLAVAVQDGMVPDHVRTLLPAPDVVFVGGTRDWKWRSLTAWTAAFPRVHVARAATYQMLWWAHRAGAESTDSSGWFRNGVHWGNPDLVALDRYLGRSARGLGERDRPGFFHR